MKNVFAAVLVVSVLSPMLSAQPAKKLLIATGRVISTVNITPPSLTCVGGQPTGAQPLCSPGTKRILTWNGVLKHEVADVKGPAAALVSGPMTLTIHCNLNESYSGNCFGTFEWPVPEMDAKWEGSFHLSIDMPANITSASAMAHGDGGKLDGLQMKYEAVYPGGTEPGVFAIKIWNDAREQ